MSLLPPGEELAAEMLGIRWPFEADGVQAAFRSTALVVHPDHGGDSRSFRMATQARDLLLAYLGGPRPSPRNDHEAPQYKSRYFWRKSSAGNLTTNIGGLNVTVFAAKSGGFCWVCDDEFSSTYISAIEAQQAAEESLS